MCTLKNLTDLCFTKQKNKNKNYFSKSYLQCFSSKNVLAEHKEDCLSINSKESVKVKEGTIEFEKYSKQYQYHLKFMLILSVI